MLASDQACFIVKYCISSKLFHQSFIHCSLVIQLVSVVKYCISSTLTVNNFLLSFSILYPLLVSVQAFISCICITLTVNDLYHCLLLPQNCLSLFINSVLYSQQCSQVHCDWILYLELVSGYSPHIHQRGRYCM